VQKCNVQLTKSISGTPQSSVTVSQISTRSTTSNFPGVYAGLPLELSGKTVGDDLTLLR